jgi:DNA uptake protein ComE-like DNA-binding protein
VSNVPVAANECAEQNEQVRNAIRVGLFAFIAFFGSAWIFAQNAAKPHTVPPPEMRVDINHASMDELTKVPGMTKSWAGRIMRFRPYRTKQDLVDHGVVSSDVYDRIKDFIIAHHQPQ